MTGTETPADFMRRAAKRLDGHAAAAADDPALVHPRVCRALAVLLNATADWRDEGVDWPEAVDVARVILDEPGGGVT